MSSERSPFGKMSWNVRLMLKFLIVITSYSIHYTKLYDKEIASGLLAGVLVVSIVKACGKMLSFFKKK